MIFTNKAMIETRNYTSNDTVVVVEIIYTTYTIS